MGALLILIPAGIHLIPVWGVRGGPGLARLYGSSPDNADIELALRHRAVLFGVLAVLLLAGLFWTELSTAAILAMLAADVAFLGLYATTPDTGAAMRRVAWADVVSVGCLLLALAAQ